MTARFAPVEIRADVSSLPANERQALREAGRSRARHGRAVPAPGLGGQRGACCSRCSTTASPVGQARLRYFLHQQGPVVAARSQPAVRAGRARRQARRGQLLSGRRDQGRGRALDGDAAGSRAGQGARLLHDDPAHAARQRLAVSARALQPRVPGRARRRRPACCARPRRSPRQPTLKRFLETRAAAFLTDDYYASPTSRGWSSTPASSRPSARTRSTRTSGSTTRRPSRRSSRCATTPRRRSCRSSARELQDIENHLPIDPSLRNPALGALAPIRVVNVVFTAGDGNRGVQTAAFNLPNDERVIREKGSKRVMLKNVQEAKFRMVLQPIAKVALARGRSAARCPSTPSSRTS